MSKIIRITDIVNIAMTEEAGKALRQLMAKAFNAYNEIVLDFDTIELFATPFFNASIGYFVLNLSPEKYKNSISVINLTDLGMETYLHSLDNAIAIYNKKEDTAEIGKITRDTIEEQ